MTSELDRYREIFVNESREIIGNLNKVMLALEKEPARPELINECFRYLHNIKGMAATMGFEKITKVSHELESAMDLVRKGEKPLSANIINALFKGIDMLDTLVNGLEKRFDGKVNVDILVKEIHACVYDAKCDALNKTAEPKVLAQEARPPVKTEEIVKPASLRIDLKVLDEMVNLAGELIISKNRLQDLVSRADDTELSGALYGTNKIMTELENAILKTRIVQADYIFNRYPRLVRDTAREHNKEVNFVIEGKEIGLDRGVLDELYDPLIHLLRNCVYHGIELPAVRKKANKEPAGTITLSAKKLENNILIEVKDDGAGLNAENIKKTAVKRGLLKAEDAFLLSDEKAYAFLTMPGFSTVETVNNTSGRGVGLDVVKTKVESLNGSFTMETVAGQGSRFIMKVPLTLAIIQALIVEVGNESFALPFSAVKEVLSAGQEEQTTVEYRGKAVRIIKLTDILKTKTDNAPRDFREVLIVEHRDEYYGLLINKIKTQHEIVVKPLGGRLKGASIISGATILGDGKVALILDVNAVIEEAGKQQATSDK